MTLFAKFLIEKILLGYKMSVFFTKIPGHPDIGARM
jgi:hypothetical protein